MSIDEAFEKASRILEEEQVAPTLLYSYDSSAWPSNKRYEEAQLRAQGYGPSIAAQIGLLQEQKQRPRQVYEDPKLYAFVSTNFNLLVKVFSQVADGDRGSLISQLLNFVRTPLPSIENKHSARFPSYEGHTSALALLAEFCIRTGYLNELLEATQHPKMPSRSLLIMLMELEQTIALNFNLFSDSQLTTMPSSLSTLREIAERQTYCARGPVDGPMTNNPHYRFGFQDLGNEIVKAIDGIAEECRKARYWYLKGALQELPNLEVENDKLQVETFLKKLGFDDLMVKSLNKAEDEYRNATTGFDLKDCLDHVRSFFEQLHLQAANAIADSVGKTRPVKYGEAIAFLRKEGIFTEKQEQLAAALFGFSSDEAVHKLIAAREFARLMRNIVIEYGVMFLASLDKRGVRI
jgi:hypothetical protein